MKKLILTDFFKMLSENTFLFTDENDLQNQYEQFARTLLAIKNEKETPFDAISVMNYTLVELYYLQRGLAANYKLKKKCTNITLH